MSIMWTLLIDKAKITCSYRSKHIKIYFVRNRAMCANLGDNSLYCVTARGCEEQNNYYFPSRGAMAIDIEF